MLGADIKVLHAVAGRGVGAAGAALQGHMVAQDNGGFPIQEGMAVGDVLQLLAQAAAQNLIGVDLGRLHGGLHQLLGHHIILPIGRHNTVLEGRPDADGHIARQGPGGGGPDHKIGLGQVRRAQLSQLPVFVVHHMELHID